MATTSSIVYCTDQDLLQTYPGIKSFDLKTRLYGFVTTDTTNMYKIYNSGLIDQLYFDGIEGTAVTDDPNANYEYRYSASVDALELFISTANPNDMIIEAGQDWENLKLTIRKRASRMVESLLDSRLSREIMKDREGNYPEFIKRATALKSCVLLMSAHDVENPMIESFNDEFDHIIEGYRSGHIQLPTAVTVDSAQGVLREVSVNANSDLRPVELKGTYMGLGYELLKVFIDTGEGGAIGTAKYTVVGRSSTGLKNETIVDSEVIDGQFQRLTPDLWIRWGGDDVASAICTEADEYEIEIHGLDVPSTVSQNGSISLTRR